MAAERRREGRREQGAGGATTGRQMGHQVLLWQCAELSAARAAAAPQQCGGDAMAPEIQKFKPLPVVSVLVPPAAVAGEVVALRLNSSAFETQ